MSAPRSRVTLVLFVSLMDTLGFGIMLPTLPFYARSLGATAEIVTLAMAVYTLGIFLSTPIWGRVSDRIGRKPVISAGLVGSLACYLVLAGSDSLALVIAARFAGGLMAGNLSACSAYLVDVTTNEERARVMGWSGAVFGMGFVFGPLLGSALGAGEENASQFVRPALTAAGMSAVALLGVLSFLPESRPRELRRMAPRPPHRRLRRRIQGLGRPLLVLGMCGALFGVASGYYETILPLWGADFGLIRGAQDMWIFFLPTGLALVSVQAFAVGPITKRFGEPFSIATAALGLSMGCIGMTAAGSSSSLPTAIALAGTMACCAAVIMATSYILVSKLAPEAERGEVLGLFSSLGTASRTAGMVLSGVLYESLHAHAPYWFAAATFFGVSVVATRLVAPLATRDASQ